MVNINTLPWIHSLFAPWPIHWDSKTLALWNFHSGNHQKTAGDSTHGNAMPVCIHVLSTANAPSTEVTVTSVVGIPCVVSM